MASFQDRVVGALRLQATTFEEVEHDASATSQAAMLVVAGALSGAIASVAWTGISWVVMAIVLQLIGWVIGSFVILIVGTKLFPGKNTEADMGQMLRTVGFANAPNLFGVLGIVPFLGLLISFVIAIWVLVAMVIGVRQALDYDDTLKAVIVCVVAWVIMLVVTMTASLFGLTAAGMAGGMM
jgi:hypothetical protein